jgi:dihydroorotase
MNIILRSPADFHTHLRGWNGDPADPKGMRPDAILRAVSPLQQYFSRVLVMPNLLPKHIETATEVDAYKKKLEMYLPEGTDLIMTISLKPTTTREIISACYQKI